MDAYFLRQICGLLRTQQQWLTKVFVETVYEYIITPALYKTFWNFINTIMRLDYCDYVDEIWNESENLSKVTEVFKPVSDSRVNKLKFNTYLCVYGGYSHVVYSLYSHFRQISYIFYVSCIFILVVNCTDIIATVGEEFSNCKVVDHYVNYTYYYHRYRSAQYGKKEKLETIGEN